MNIPCILRCVGPSAGFHFMQGLHKDSLTFAIYLCKFVLSTQNTGQKIFWKYLKRDHKLVVIYILDL